MSTLFSFSVVFFNNKNLHTKYIDKKFQHLQKTPENIFEK